MPIQSSALTLNIAELSARLLEELEILPRARMIAQAIADVLPGNAVNVYAASALTDKDEWAVLATAEGSLRARVRVVVAVKPGVVVMTHGWWQSCDVLALPAHSPHERHGANVNRLASNRWQDPVSGATALRGIPCRVERCTEDGKCSVPASPQHE